MPSKFDVLRKKLEPWAENDSYQEKIEEQKKEYIGLDAGSLARIMQELEDLKEGFEAQAKAQNVKLSALSQLLVDNFENQGIELLAMESGYKAVYRIKPRVTVLAEKKDDYLKWLKKRSIRAMFTLSTKTRDVLITDDLIQGKPAPVWAKVFSQRMVRIEGKKKQQDDSSEQE